jgi:hypothetical protein
MAEAQTAKTSVNARTAMCQRWESRSCTFMPASFCLSEAKVSHPAKIASAIFLGRNR